MVSIKSSAFSNSGVEKIDISSCNVEFNEGWLYCARHLNEIIVSPSNCHFIYKDNQLLLGKTNSFNNNYDVLIFARRDIKEVTIPANVTVIAQYSLAECYHLKSIKFSDQSSLSLISENAFCDSLIERISIPSHVTEIGCSAFNKCGKLKIIEFQKNSELKTIGRYAFRCSSINSFVIPASVSRIGDEAFVKYHDSLIIEISENSQLQKINISWFDNTIENIIMAPAKMFDENINPR